MSTKTGSKNNGKTSTRSSKNGKTHPLSSYLKWWPWIVGGLFLLLLISVLISPYMVSRNIHHISLKGKPSDLLPYTDTDSIQKNITNRLKQELQHDIQIKNTNSRFFLIGEVMAPLMVEREAWEYSQRDSILKSIQMGRMIKNEELYTSLTPTAVEQTKKYKGFNEFWIVDKSEQGASVVFVLRRTGIWSWKIKDIFPAE